MTVIFLITTLKPGVSRHDYETWLARRDYPFMAGLKSVVDFQVHRIQGDIAGAADAGWMYVERIVVSDRAAYEKELDTDAGRELREELFALVDRPRNIRFLADPV